MDKFAIATILEEIGSMLEMKGENPFKSRAYHNASRVVAGLSDLPGLVRDKTLCEVKGLGKSMCGHIEGLLATGRDPYYEELQKDFPAGLLELIRVQGVGPKRALILYKKLKIQDVAGLEKAAKEGKIAKLEGFGEKSQEKILKGLEFLGKHAEYHHYNEAADIGNTVVEELKNLPGVQRISVCGSLRRHREVVRDIDVLISSKNAKPIMERFVKLPNVVQILGEGETKSSVLTFEGYQIDLRVVEDADFPFALHYFTGSKEHNVAVRHIANTKGLTLNEYGLFKMPKGAKADIPPQKQGIPSLKCKDEAELFGKLGLAYIPPEMREDRGEIEAAQKNKVPKLIEPGDIRGVFHVHSTWSDGKASLEDMISEAQRLGWEYVGISDHSKTATYAHGLEVERVKQQAKEIEALRKKYKIRIFWGSECDILKDGTMDYDDAILANYDFVIASVHSQFNLPEAEQTQRICKALKNKYVTILGHMTGRLLLNREPYAVDQTEVLTAAAGEGVAVELNAQPHRFDIDWRMLPVAREKGVKISINPDAHSVKQLSVVPYGVGIARKGWLTKDDVINTLPLKPITEWLGETSMTARNQDPGYVKKLVATLRKQWPKPLCEVNHSNPLELMVGVILSAQSTDKRVNQLTQTLFKKYRTAKDYAEANPPEFEQEIKPAGFFRSKARSIITNARMLVSKHNGIVPKTMEELLELPGIGRKSANVVLGAGYGITSGIVVDTHMIRLCTERLQLSKQEDPVKLEADLVQIVPRKDWVFFSQSMVLHGRYICVARKPRCFECELIKICPFADKNFERPADEPAERKTITGVPIKSRRS